MFFIRDPFTEQASGPYNGENLQQMMADGTIGDFWEVSKSKQGPWTPAGKVPWLHGDVIQSSKTKFDASYQGLEQQRHAAAPPPIAVPTPSERPRGVVGEVQERVRKAAVSSEFDRAIDGDDSLFKVVGKLIYGAKEYSFHDRDFPALAACLRIGASFARIYFVVVLLLLLLCGFVLILEPNPRALGIWISLTGEEVQTYLETTRDGIEIRATPFCIVYAVIRHFFIFLGIMACFELIRVVIAIEKNTRQ
jgi:hypothetical protein